MYDRIQVKERAKAAIRETRPKAWVVTLVYTLLTSLVGTVVTAVGLRPLMTAGILAQSGASADTVAQALGQMLGVVGMVSIFLALVVTVYAMVMQFGYTNYCLKVQRGQSAGYGDLFHGFHMLWKVVALNLWILLYTVLWSLAMVGIIMAGALVGTLFFALFNSTFLMVLLLLALYTGGVAFLLNRVLRYEMAPYLLLDHPDWSASDCIQRSKEMMSGRIWSLVVLQLSFFGWSLLTGLISSAVMGIGMALMGQGLGDLQGINASLLPYYLLYSGVGGILVYVVSWLCAMPLAMWVNAYAACAAAGFYEAGLAPQTPPPVAPWTPQPLDQGPGGNFYGGFGTGAQPPAEDPPKPPEDPSVGKGYYTGKKEDPWD